MLAYVPYTFRQPYHRFVCALVLLGRAAAPSPDTALALGHRSSTVSGASNSHSAPLLSLQHHGFVENPRQRHAERAGGRAGTGPSVASVHHPLVAGAPHMKKKRRAAWSPLPTPPHHPPRACLHTGPF